MTGVGALERREYRWMWLYRATQAILVLLIIVPTFVLYWPAKGIVWLFDLIGDRRGDFYVKCYNRDLARRRRSHP